MHSMYDDAPQFRPDRRLESSAALWTEAAQQRYTELTNLPDDLQRTVRMEIGYLNESKQAAEELNRKAK